MKSLKETIAEMLQQEKYSFSDIHIEAGLPMRVRVPRGLVPVDTDTVVSQSQILDFLGEYGEKTADAWQQLIDANKGQVNTRFAIENVNLRVALFNSGGRSATNKRKWSLALRVLPSKIPDITEIGIPLEFRSLCRRENGIIFVTGITGSGKSTTTASAIEDLNTQTQNRIITLEDPMEYIFTSKASMITQRQLGDDFPDFATGVKQAMRQDPNVIVIGEVNDLPSLRGAMTAALSGHLVITTMHTVDATETVSRVIDLYPAEEKKVMSGIFSQLLLGVVSQKLIPSVKGDRYHLAHEIMTNNRAITSLIKEDKLQQIPNEIDKQRPLQHVMNASLAMLVEEEKITLEDAEGASPEPANLKEYFGRKFNHD